MAGDLSLAAKVLLDAIEVALRSTGRRGGFTVDLARNTVLVWEHEEQNPVRVSRVEGLPEFLALMYGVGVAVDNGAELAVRVKP